MSYEVLFTCEDLEGDFVDVLNAESDSLILRWNGEEAVTVEVAAEDAVRLRDALSAWLEGKR